MKTFLLDLHGGLAEFGPAAPLLYPLQEAGELQIVGRRGAGGGERGLAGLAQVVRIELMREFRARWLALFLVDLPTGAGGPLQSLAEQLDEIRQLFLERLAERGLAPARVLVVAVDALAREPHTGAPLDPGARHRWQSDVDRLSADPSAALRGLTVVRFPLRRTPEPRFQQDLVHLVYLLLSLIEVMESDEELPRGQLYQAQEVALDSSEVARWMEEYIRCLEEAEKTVAHRLAHPEPATLQLIRNPQCACGQALEGIQLPAPSFGWFHQLRDRASGHDWGQGTGATLATHERRGEEILHRCMEERRTRRFEVESEEIPSLEEKAVQLRERLHAARHALLQESPPAEEGWDWEDEMRRQTPLLAGRIEARPRPRAFAIVLAALLVLLLAPALLTVPGAGPLRLLPPALLLLGGGLAASALALHRLRSALKDAADAALKSARRIALRISERLERQRRHLERLCEAEAARYDEAGAREALAERGREVLLLRYHRDALQHHLRLARTLRSFHAADLPDHSFAPAATSGPQRQSIRDRSLEEPPHRHPVYAPARCTGTRNETTHELRIGARHLPWTSSLSRGLRHVRLVVDPIYTGDPPPPLPPRGA